LELWNVTVHVFQIGCQDIGRLGFEKFLEFEKYFPADVKFEGIHCRDFEAEERAQKFAEALNRDVEFFEGIDDLYSAAEEAEGEVLIYDAGPPQLHRRNITESLRHGFHHLTEKPPSVSRDEHIAERKLAANSSVNYKVDFIERENPVVKKVRDLVSGDSIEKVEVFRESSFGVQKVLQPVDFAHVKGGAVLDKMSNDIYVLDMLDEEFEFEDADIDFFMPKNLGGEKVLRTDGGGAREIDGRTAIGKCTGKFFSGDAEVELNGSWLGLSDRSHIWNQKIEEKFGKSILREEHQEIDGKGFQDEECRFFTIEGERKLLADLMHQRIYDLGDGEEIDVPDHPRDQLYRVFERAVLDAAGIEENRVDEEEVDRFMNALFDIQESSDGELFDAVDEASEHIRSLMTSDKKISDEADMQGVAR
jgi:predicted dehydrogenase